MLWNFIVDHIPLWGWVVIIGVPVLAAFYFASPVLVPLWNLLPGWMKWAIGGVVAIFLALMGGRYKGYRDAEEAERKRNEEALRKRQEVDQHVDNLDKKGVDTELDRWRRD